MNEGVNGWRLEGLKEWLFAEYQVFVNPYDWLVDINEGRKIDNAMVGLFMHSFCYVHKKFDLYIFYKLLLNYNDDNFWFMTEKW